jgi:hypothetical protein
MILPHECVTVSRITPSWGPFVSISIDEGH